MHPAAPLPRYDCKCVLWQPSKHNLLAHLLIFRTPVLPVSWHSGNGEIELCVLFFVPPGDQVLLTDLVQGWEGTLMLSPAHLHTLNIHMVTLYFCPSLYLGTHSHYFSNSLMSLPQSIFLQMFSFHFILFMLSIPLSSLCLFQCNTCSHFPHTQRLITGGGGRRKENKSEWVWVRGRERVRERAEGEKEREGGIERGRGVLGVNYSSYAWHPRAIYLSVSHQVKAKERE